MSSPRSRPPAHSKITLPGFSDSSELTRVEDDLPLHPSPNEPSRSFPEIEFVHEQGASGRFDGPFAALAIWTQRRIYLLDQAFVCRGVLDRKSLMPVDQHPILGATFVYGQCRDGEGNVTQLSRPLPELGSQAIFGRTFGKNVRLSETSPVTRVVLRQHRVDIAPK